MESNFPSSEENPRKTKIQFHHFLCVIYVSKDIYQKQQHSMSTSTYNSYFKIHNMIGV